MGGWLGGQAIERQKERTQEKEREGGLGGSVHTPASRRRKCFLPARSPYTRVCVSIPAACWIYVRAIRRERERERKKE